MVICEKALSVYLTREIIQKDENVPMVKRFWAETGVNVKYDVY